MSKGTWFRTRDTIAYARWLALNDPKVGTRAQLVKAVAAGRRISYARANYAVGKALSRYKVLFDRYGKHEDGKGEE